jgi:hypothetical protein
VVDYLYTNIVNLGRDVPKVKCRLSVPEIGFDGNIGKQSSFTEDNIEALCYCRDSQGGGFVLTLGTTTREHASANQYERLPSARLRLRGKTPLKILHDGG